MLKNEATKAEKKTFPGNMLNTQRNQDPWSSRKLTVLETLFLTHGWVGR